MIKIREIFCRSILSKSKLPGCDYVINPYVGCAHGCVWCLHPETLILTLKGFVKIIDIYNQRNNKFSGQAVAHKGNTQPINDYFKHPYNGNLVKIRPFYFGWLKLTPNHKVFAIRRRELVCSWNRSSICYPKRKNASIDRRWFKRGKISCRICNRKREIKPKLIQAGELAKGDFILIPVPREIRDIKTIQVERVLSNIKAYHKIGRKLPPETIRKIFDLGEKGLSTRKIGAKLKISSTAVATYLSGKRSKEREFEVGILQKGNFVRFKGSKKKIPARIPLSKNFMRLVGYYLSEGWVSISKNRPNSAQICFTFSANEKDYIADVKNLTREIFGVSLNEIFRERDKAVTLSCGINTAALFFASLFGRASTDKKIPSEFLFLPTGKQRELLKGLFRGDGTITRRPESSARPTCFITTSEDVKNSVQLMLLRCGILAGVSISKFGKKRKNEAFIIAPASQYQQKFADLFDIGARVKNGRNLYGVIVGNKFAIVPIRLLEKERYNGPVFNLSVRKDHSYTANFVAVSNCYARFMKRYTGHDKEEWGSFVDIKVNAPEVLIKDIKRLKAKPTIFLSSVCDSYQPVEAKYKITRQCLEILSQFSFPIAILTQSKLVTRDIDLFKKFKEIEVGMSFITMNEKATRIFQPLAASPGERVKALKKLHQAGIKTYIHVGPILPYFTDFDEIFRATHQYLDSAMAETLNTRGENWTNLIKVLSKHYPQLLPQFKKWKFKDLNYLGQIGVDFEKAAKRFKIKVSGVYHHT